MNYQNLLQKKWAVFPLVPGTKVPYKDAGGHTAATNEPAVAATLFAGKTCCNTGVATGKPSGVFVVDCDQDPSTGKVGLENFQLLADKHGGLMPTRYVMTPRGGVHFYYKMPADGRKVPCSVGKIAPAVDIRGDGGYVVSEGSIVNGKSYVCENPEVEPAEAPDWLLDLVARKTTTPEERIKKSLVRAEETWVAAALDTLNPACGYQDWLAVGMALKDWDEVAGLPLWDAWSRKSPEKYESGQCADKWGTFSGSGITVGTLFHMAKERGWTPPQAVEIRDSIIATLTGKGPEFKKTAAICTAVLDLLCKQGQLFFHEQERDFASCMYFDASRKVLLPIQSDEFLAWLSSLTGVSRASNLFRHMAQSIETEALGGSRTRGTVPNSYWCRTGDRIYLSNGDGAMVRITREGLELLDNGTDGVLFSAGKTLQPWDHAAEPRDIFRECRVFSKFNGVDEHGVDLFRAWLYSLPTNPLNKPILCMVGEIGSGKTRAIQAACEFYGIPFRAVKASESGENDFWVGMNAGGVYTLDNVDSHIRWLADNAANASTGGCGERRKLYTDNTTVVLKPNSWLVLTTANPLFAQDAGLSDRLLVIRMGRLTDETGDSVLTEEIMANRDAGLVHLALTLGKAMREPCPTVVVNRRHPDFASFAARVGSALACYSSITSALREAEDAKAIFCLENDSVMSALLEVLEAKGAEGFKGPMSDLVHEIKVVDEGLEWLTPKKLGKRLASHWSFLTRKLKICQKQNHGTREVKMVYVPN